MLVKAQVCMMLNAIDMKWLRVICGCLTWMAALVHACGAEADVYLYVDDAGVAHYTNVPSQGHYQLLVALLQEEQPENRAKTRVLPAAAEGLAPVIARVAEAHKVDGALIHAVITAESGYNSVAISAKGAQGLMQLMPGTAKRYAVENAFDPVQNIEGGTRYLAYLMKLFDSDLELVLAAYNAGEGAVNRHGRKVPPYRETQAYVPKVIRLYDRYKTML
jgi:soluble lytic murein transglycosylase-like protein